MIVSEKIRADIAYQIIRTIAPVAVISIIITIPSIYLLTPNQAHRYYPLLIALITIIPPWLFSIKGKPLIGAHFLIVCFVATITTGMYVSGGVYAPLFNGVLSMIAVLVCLYGMLRSILFVVMMVFIGAVFLRLEQLQMLPYAAKPPPSLILVFNAVWMTTTLLLYGVPITMLQKALKEKNIAEKELQSIISKTPDIIYRLDPAGRFIFISDAAKQYGYDPSDLIGKHIDDFIHPDDKDGVEHAIHERRSGLRGTRNREVRFFVPKKEKIATIGPTNHDDTWIPFNISSDGIYSGDQTSVDTYLGVQGVARDISKTKHYEEQVSRLAAVVEQASEDVIITDTRGIIKYVNPAFEKITGYGRKEVLGKTPKILKSKKHDRPFYAKMWRTIKQGHTWKGYIWNKKKNGGLILQDVTITPILDASNKLTGYASLRRDVTLQKRIQEQLQQAQKMEAIGTLAGGIAHDFNNILSGILGYTELALDDVKKIPEAKDKLERILEGGKRASELVRQILSFSRNQKKEPMPIIPKIIAKEVLKLLRASLPATIEIKQQLTSDSYIFADATNIHQVLMNLCTNAGHAMRNTGGILSVRLKDVSFDKNEVTPYIGLAVGKYLKITVEDTGHGIPKNIQKKVFDPFFTTKAMGEGTGMGLSAVHGIVKELGGTVTLYSEVGKGTTFNVFIPIITALADTKQRIEPALPMGGTEKIIFVDDEKVQMELAIESLGRMGYQVTGFSDSVAALDHFKQHSTEYDLVITDMSMPKMTGDKLTRKIHYIRPEIPVIMCTGLSEIMDEEIARAINISAFLHKPVIAREMLRVIRKTLE
jgi:PAS domain S-box-containing protein